MKNLKRYDYKLTNPTTYAIEMVESKSGEYVKFSDIKDILNSTPNTAMLQLLCELRDYLGCGVENRKSDIDFIDRIDVALAQQQHS